MSTPQVTQSISLDAFDVWLESCPFSLYTNPASLQATSATVQATAGTGSRRRTH